MCLVLNLDRINLAVYFRAEYCKKVVVTEEKLLMTVVRNFEIASLIGVFFFRKTSVKYINKETAIDNDDNTDVYSRLQYRSIYETTCL